MDDHYQLPANFNVFSYFLPWGYSTVQLKSQMYGEGFDLFEVLFEGFEDLFCFGIAQINSDRLAI